MIYALQEIETGELLACTQMNGYDLAYYGILQWDSQLGEAEIMDALTRADRIGAHGTWQSVELSEHQAKMANVKLRNDARRQVFLRDGNLTASQLEA